MTTNALNRNWKFSPKISKKKRVGFHIADRLIPLLSVPHSDAEMSSSTDEVNFLVYRYLHEAGFYHSAYGRLKLN